MSDNHTTTTKISAIVEQLPADMKDWPSFDKMRDRPSVLDYIVRNYLQRAYGLVGAIP